jgi:hypothetical protein
MRCALPRARAPSHRQLPKSRDGNNVSLSTGQPCAIVFTNAFDILADRWKCTEK